VYQWPRGSCLMKKTIGRKACNTVPLTNVKCPCTLISDKTDSFATYRILSPEIYSEKVLLWAGCGLIWSVGPRLHINLCFQSSLFTKEPDPDIQEWIRTFRKRSGHSGTDLDIQEQIRSFRNRSGHSGTDPDIQEYIPKLRNRSGN
jgi:hypothetical protein